MMRETFGERLRRLRKRSGLGQVELGRCIGVSKSAISVWECGRLPLHVALVSDQLAKVFGVTGYYMRFGQEASERRLAEAERRNRPRWSIPEPRLIALAREGRAEIAQAEGYARPPA